MRSGVILLLAIVLAAAAAPAGAQEAPPPPDVEKPEKGQKPPKGGKPDKEERPPKGEQPDEDVEPPEEGGEGGPVEGEVPGPGAEEPPTAEEPVGGEPVDGEADRDGARGGPGPAGVHPATQLSDSTDADSTDEDGLGSPAGDADCPEACEVLGAVAGGEQRDAILLSAGSAEAEDGSLAFSAPVATNASPAVLVLFGLMAVGLLVGIGGGLRALRGRINGG